MTRAVRSRGLDAALTSVAQIAVLAGAALMGILIGARFGVTPATDGFFVANSIYGVILFVAQSLRTTAVSRLVGDEAPFPRLNAHLEAIAVLAVAALMLALVAALAIGFTNAAPATRDGFREAILVLVPAAALQLFAGLGSAALATLDDFMTPALAFGAGAVVNVAAFLVLTPSLGVDGVPVALVCGAATACVGIARALLHAGWRPRVPRPRRPAVHVAGRLALGAGALVAAQIVLTVSVAASGASVTGGATIFAYASMAIMVLTAGLASPIAIVFAPAVAREWDRRPETLVPLTLRAFRAGAMLLVPAAAAIVLLGVKPGEVLLSKVDDDDITEVFRLVCVLAPSVLGTMLSMIPLTGALTVQRLGPLAGWSLVVAAVHALACTLAIALGGGLVVLAALTTTSSILLALVPTTLALQGSLGAVLTGAAVAVADLVAVPAAAFGAAGFALDAWSSLARGVAAFAIGAAVSLVWIVARHRRELFELAGALLPSSS